MQHSSPTKPTQTEIDENEKIFDDGYFRIEHENYYATCGGEYIRLTRIEFLFLSRLARNPGRVIASEELWEYAHRHDKAPLRVNTLRVHIYRLRHLLEPFGIKIESLINAGYRLVLNKN